MKMAKAKAGKGGKSAGPTEMLVVASKVKNLVRDADLRMAGDAIDGLNQLVYDYIQRAIRRAAAKGNNRKTILAHDFHI
jgi:hypothetical protein